jgi:segregation and condensation protein B
MTPRPSRKKPEAPEIPENPDQPQEPSPRPEAEAAPNAETPVEASVAAAAEALAEPAASAEAPSAPAETTETRTSDEPGAVADAPLEPVDPSRPTPATDPALLRRALEALLFITDRPLSAGELAKLVGMRDQDRIVGAVEEFRRDLEAMNLGYRLIAVAEGWQMATRAEFAPYVRRLFADRATMRLSTAAQETLSIVAYKQPLTRAEVEQIRGGEVIAALETLLEKRLLKVVGRKETVGRPLMYGTTPEFLRHFGLRSLEDLPPFDSFTPAEDAPAASAPADAASAPAPELPAEHAVSEPAPVEAAAPVAEPVPDAETGPDEESAENP